MDLSRSVKNVLSIVLVFLSSIVAEAYPLKSLIAQEKPNERKIREIREAEIKQIKVLIEQGGVGKREADYWFRLSELYFEAYGEYFILEGRVFEKKRKSKGTINRKQSRAQLNKGLTAAKRVISIDPAYSKLDRVYFFLGFNSRELGQKNQARNYFLKVVNDFSGSRLRGDAFRELGNIEFASKGYKKARTYYERSLDIESEQPAVLQKLAWCQYRLRQSKSAIATMKLAIEEAQEDREKYLSIQDEALRDLAVFIVESGSVEEGIRYFKSVGRNQKENRENLEALADEYEKRGIFSAANKVYLELVQFTRSDERRFRYLAKVLDLRLKREDHEGVLSILERAKFPQEESDFSDKESKVAFRDLKAKVRKTAIANHNQYRKTKTQSYLITAEGYYGVYLKRFLRPSEFDTERSEIRMYIAEIYSARGNTARAIAEYKRVIKADSKKYVKSASLLWLDLAQKRLNGAKKGAKKKELKAAEEDWLEAVDQIYLIQRDSKLARQSMLEAAQLVAARPRSLGEALDRAKKIERNSPSTKEAITAANLRLQIVEDQVKDPRKSKGEDYRLSSSQLTEVVGEIQSNKALLAYDRKSNRSRLSSRLSGLKTQLAAEKIISLEKDQNFSRAAEEYEKFADLVGSTTKSEQALEGAVNSYIQSGRNGEAVRVGLVWLKRFPKSKKVRNLLPRLATTLFIRGEFESSATVLGELGKKTGNSSYLASAALIEEGLGSYDGAIRYWNFAQEKTKDLKTRADRLIRISNLSRANENSKGSIAALKSCLKLKTTRKAQCAFYLAEYHSASYESVIKLGRTYRKSPFYGYALFRIAENYEARANLPELTFPEKQLQESLNSRLDFFAGLNKRYRKVVEAGGPWAVSALYRLSDWTIRFARELEALRPPRSFTVEDRNRFKTTIQSVSGPLRKQAADALTQAWDTAQRSSLLNADLPNAMDLLADLKTGKNFGRAQGIRLGFDFVGKSFRSGGDLKEDVRELRGRLEKNPSNAELWVDYGNALWTMKRPLFAKEAYFRATRLNPKLAFAWNNLGVIEIRQGSPENWLDALAAQDFFMKANSLSKKNPTLQINLALLYNYYRLFQSAYPLWLSLSRQFKNGLVLDGFAIATQGMGKDFDARKLFDQADRDAGSDRFARVYHDAARASTFKEDPGEKCIDRLEDMEVGDLKGFELRSYQNLLLFCQSLGGGI